MISALFARILRIGTYCRFLHVGRDVSDVHAHGRYLGTVELSGCRRTHVGQHAERRMFKPPRGIRRFG